MLVFKRIGVGVGDAVGEGGDIDQCADTEREIIES